MLVRLTEHSSESLCADGLMVSDSVMGLDPLRSPARIMADVALGQNSLTIEELQEVFKTIS